MSANDSNSSDRDYYSDGFSGILVRDSDTKTFTFLEALEHNINGILGKNLLPYLYSRIGTEILAEPEFTDIIIELNKKGFYTFNSQCSVDSFIAIPNEFFEQEMGYKIITGKKSFGRNVDNTFNCIIKQREYCEGIMTINNYEKILHKLQDKYFIYHRDNIGKEIELTTHDCGDFIYNLTNYFPEIVEESHEFSLISNYYGFDKSQFIHIVIIAKQFNNKTDIFDDILSVL